MFPTCVMHSMGNQIIVNVWLSLRLDVVLCNFWLGFLFTCHVSNIWPLANTTFIFHCILTLTFISSVKPSIHFPNFTWFYDVQEVFNYVVRVVKQISYEQSKQVNILTNVYSKVWNWKLHILEVKFNLVQFSPWECQVVKLMTWSTSMLTSSIVRSFPYCK
jgi:hypothetical protein